MENFDGFRHTVHISHNVNGVVEDYAIPMPASITKLGSAVTINADELELVSPASNTDLIYVLLEGVATAGTPSKPIAPGETKRFSGAGRQFLSAITASGTQVLDVTAFYR